MNKLFFGLYSKGAKDMSSVTGLPEIPDAKKQLKAIVYRNIQTADSDSVAQYLPKIMGLVAKNADSIKQCKNRFKLATLLHKVSGLSNIVSRKIVNFMREKKILSEGKASDAAGLFTFDMGNWKEKSKKKTPPPEVKLPAPVKKDKKKKKKKQKKEKGGDGGEGEGEGHAEAEAAAGQAKKKTKKASTPAEEAEGEGKERKNEIKQEKQEGKERKNEIKQEKQEPEPETAAEPAKKAKKSKK